MIRSGDQAVFEATIATLPIQRRRYESLVRFEQWAKMWDGVPEAMRLAGVSAQEAAARMAGAFRRQTPMASGRRVRLW